NKIDRLEEFAERFEAVVLENLDWRELIEKYDALETVFYFDPPYVGQGSVYPAGGVDHGELVETLQSIDGYACRNAEW
ncbi:MAG: DNA adenine methylase, partial [Halobacteriaceae archaeon]